MSQKYVVRSRNKVFVNLVVNDASFFKEVDESTRNGFLKFLQSREGFSARRTGIDRFRILLECEEQYDQLVERILDLGFARRELKPWVAPLSVWMRYEDAGHVL